MYAVIRVRGSVGTSPDIEKTLELLRLLRVNHCAMVPRNANFDGMLKRAGDYITWGEVNEDILEDMLTRKGRIKGASIEKKQAETLAKEIIKENSVKGIDSLFRLSPPSKGFKSIKKHYPKGAAGYRGDKINELLKRMI